MERGLTRKFTDRASAIFCISETLREKSYHVYTTHTTVQTGSQVKKKDENSSKVLFLRKRKKQKTKEKLRQERHRRINRPLYLRMKGKKTVMAMVSL